MYGACIFCHSSLGRNEVVEPFPVGRRLAFDGATGRLWVVCPHCARWNLTPLEERWEAIEECERLFRDARHRVSGENIGLAQLPGELVLVRVGRPVLAELAHWRYGSTLTEQWRRGRWGRAAVRAAKVGFAVTAMMPYVNYAYAVIGPVAMVVGDLLDRRVIARVPLAGGERLALDRDDLRDVRLLRDPSTDAGWELEIPHRGGITSLRGEPAIQAGAQVLAVLSRGGAPAVEVEGALEQLRGVRAPDEIFRLASDQLRASGHLNVTALPRTSALALEMAAQEARERRALAGELAELERAWKDAEELAKIADDLLLPASVRQRLDQLLRR